MNTNPTANHTKSGFHRAAFKAKRVFKKFFIAHEENDHHPHIFRIRSVISFLICLIALEGGLFLYVNKPINIGSQKAAVIANALVAYTNDARTAESLPALTRNETLDAAAALKAQDMISKGYFAHYAPDGTTPWHWLDEAGYRYASAGENLAIDFVDSKDVVDAWMKSPTHRANIVKQKYTEIGMAVAEGQFNNHKTIFVVQFFGMPSSPAAAVVAPVAPTPTQVTANIAPAPVPVAPAAMARASSTATSIATSAGISSAVAIATSTASSTATSSVASAGAISTPTSTQIVAESAVGPEVAGLFTEKDPNMFARVSNELFGFVASPRNTMEVILFILIACVLLATLLYMHGSKNPKVHRIVASVSISLVIILALLIMMNRTFLRMTNDDLAPAAETVLETE